MIQDFVNFLGQGYAPIVTALPDGTYDVSIDWSYIGAIVFVIVALYAVLRILGALLCGSRR